MNELHACVDAVGGMWCDLVPNAHGPDPSNATHTTLAETVVLRVCACSMQPSCPALGATHQLLIDCLAVEQHMAQLKNA